MRCNLHRRRERECYSRWRVKGQTKQAPCVRGRQPAEPVSIRLANGCKFVDRVRHPHWLISFPPEWDRRQIRRVGFNEQAIVRNEAKEIIVRPFLEGDDAAECDVPAGVDGEFGKGARAGVTVENARSTGRARLADHGAGVILGVSRVNDERLLDFCRQSNLGRKCDALRLAG